MSADKLEAEAVEILERTVWKLPPGIHDGTVRLLVRLIVDAAVERARVQQAADRVLVQHARETLNLPRKEQRK